MKKKLKILLIVCLVLGVALMALWGYVRSNEGTIAAINERISAYNQIEAQVEMARVLGKSASGVRMRLTRVRRRFKALLMEGGILDEED